MSEAQLRRGFARGLVRPAKAGAAEPTPDGGTLNVEILDKITGEVIEEMALDWGNVNDELEKVSDNIADAGKKTADWQKTLVGVTVILGKIRGVFGQITGAAKQTLRVNERLAAMQHIVLGAVRQTSEAWLLVARATAQVWSLVENIPITVIAATIATLGLLAVFKAIAVLVTALSFNPYIIAMAAVAFWAAKVYFETARTRKETDAIKGTWTDITNLWKNAMSFANAVALPSTGGGRVAQNTGGFMGPGAALHMFGRGIGRFFGGGGVEPAPADPNRPTVIIVDPNEARAERFRQNLRELRNTGRTDYAGWDK